MNYCIKSPTIMECLHPDLKDETSFCDKCLINDETGIFKEQLTRCTYGNKSQDS